MSRSRNLDRMTRYQWFESGFLQRRLVQTIGSSAVILSLHRAAALRRLRMNYSKRNRVTGFRLRSVFSHGLGVEAGHCVSCGLASRRAVNDRPFVATGAPNMIKI